MQKRAYRIAAIIDGLPFSQARALRRTMPERIGVCRQTWHRYLTAQHGSKVDIPASRLRLIAGALGVPMEQLLTPNP